MAVGERVGLEVELERVAEQRIVADEHVRVEHAQHEPAEDDRGERATEPALGHGARRALHPSHAASSPTAASTSSAGSKAWRSRGTP